MMGTTFSGLGAITPPSPGSIAIVRVRIERDFHDGLQPDVTDYVHEWSGYTAATALAYRVGVHKDAHRPFIRDGMTLITTRTDGWTTTEYVTFEDPEVAR